MNIDFEFKRIADITTTADLVASVKWVWRNYLYILEGGSTSSYTSLTSGEFYKINLKTGEKELLVRPSTSFLRTTCFDDASQVVLIDNFAYIVAGGTSSTPSNKVYKYDMLRDTWTGVKASEFFGLDITFSCGVCLIGRWLYFTGGTGKDNMFYRFNVDTKELKDLASKNYNGAYPELVYKDKKIFCYYRSTSASVPHFEVYDIELNTWQQYFFSDTSANAISGCGFVSNIEVEDKMLYSNYAISTNTSTYWKETYPSVERVFSLVNKVTYSNIDIEFVGYPEIIDQDIKILSNGTTKNENMNYAGKLIMIGKTDNLYAICCIGNKSYKTGEIGTVEMDYDLDINNITSIEYCAQFKNEDDIKALISVDSGTTYKKFNFMSKVWETVDKSNVTQGNTLEELTKINFKELSVIDSKLKLLVGMKTSDCFSTPILKSIIFTTKEV